MTNLTPYTLPQSVFLLNLAANSLFEQKASQQDLQNELAAFLAGAPATSDQGPFFTLLNTPSPDYPCLSLPAADSIYGDWGLVWGPVVFQAELNSGATNAMYVAHSPSQAIYVVAIAGTNPTGWTAACIEDLDVRPETMKVWPPRVDNGGSLVFSPAPQPVDASIPYIDYGTAFGISKLYAMKDQKSGQTLVDYLNSLGATGQAGQTLVFTGHSLGGALSPTLAMLLYPDAAASKKPAYADAPNPEGSNWADVFILASAGPSPGTPGFAAQFCTPVSPPPALGPAVPQPVAPTIDQKGPYAPVATKAAASAYAAWTIDYWNMNYANVYDVVPRAWVGLGDLVVEPAAKGDDYTSFFAGGAQISSKEDIKLLGKSAGAVTYDLITFMQARSGYSGTATKYYAECLVQSPLQGQWGGWQAPDSDKTVVYPPAWVAETPPSVVPTFTNLFTWVLNAHLSQYSQALLGYPCPTTTNAPI